MSALVKCDNINHLKFNDVSNFIRNLFAMQNLDDL